MARLGRSYPVCRVFAPVVAAPVFYSATGVGAQSTTSPLTWTDTVPATANCAVLWVIDRASVTSPAVSASVGGVAMTLNTTFQYFTSAGFRNILCFVLLNPPIGASKTISFSTASIMGVSANIVYYSNVTSVGTAVTALAVNSSATIGTPSVPKSVYTQCFSFIASGLGQGFSAYNQTQRSAQTAATNCEPLLIGDAAGTGATVTFSATCATTSGWGGIILPLT